MGQFTGHPRNYCGENLWISPAGFDRFLFPSTGWIRSQKSPASVTVGPSEKLSETVTGDQEKQTWETAATRIKDTTWFTIAEAGGCWRGWNTETFCFRWSTEFNAVKCAHTLHDLKFGNSLVNDFVSKIRFNHPNFWNSNLGSVYIYIYIYINDCIFRSCHLPSPGLFCSKFHWDLF